MLLNIEKLKVEARGEEGWTPILHGVDLQVARGEVVGLIGESGAGKSTLGLAALGFAQGGLRFAGGRVIFDGTDLLQLPERRRRAFRGRRVAYVAQSAAASFNPAWRLLDQFCEGPAIHHTADRAESEAFARRLYAAMHLPDPEHFGLRFPHQVSGGQLQRAMVAMAMACKPDLIVFDEPTTALDVTTQIGVLAAIRQAVETTGTAAIYITHDLAVVAQMADRIKVMRHGREVEDAPTRRMIEAPAQDYTRSLWAVRAFRRPPRTLPQASAPTISIREVTAGYSSLDVLSEVSFDIPRGATVAVVGESGSGKSTTARAITGLLPPRAGSIALNGTPLPPRLAQRGLEQKRAVQMIYQMADTALNPRQTIRQILSRPLQFYLGLTGRAREARLNALMEQIELEPARFLDRLPGELSGGQKQRIGIARALAADPEFIICDEVTSALDQLVAEGILRLLSKVQDETGVSYMFITHDIATVRAIADEVVVMRGGRVMDKGLKAEVLDPPRHAYTRELLASVPQMDPDWLTRRIAEGRIAEGAA
ncbi:ABC transporter ATP-binding protein [Paracoccus pantotrophus]|uniref:ABC transporter ATP-binding protein n=1 Tax=Paracoccus pantotrophus TaxID=82367 RepID=UPI0004648765|nr:ABC transporter ATP-binding protein [Paracoccus pantotrophus]MDF3853804.1 ABC transporter ATP-binding protein [Paracoccus pantotrophus]RNI15238.1 ABC transporter ATP-binding protein [Paracoccus pantotrophus]SFO50682.1 peptide/nickel transport system ATP-binding protein [Paracoccus pantotrophus]